jgi:Lon protease-like protein
MVQHALEADRVIGMVLLRPGYEADYAGRPPVFSIGCAGFITHADPLPDGRYNIVLRGLDRFRITGEETTQSFRLAHVEVLPESAGAEDRAAMAEHRQRLESLLAAAVEHRGLDPRLPSAIPSHDLVNTLAQYLALEPIERQALLECDGVLGRCQALIDLLEMKTMLAPGQGPWTSVH